MKYFAMVAVVLSLSACGYIDRVTAAASGYSTVCVNGVEYIQFTSGASVAYGTDRQIKLCNK